MKAVTALLVTLFIVLAAAPSQAAFVTAAQASPPPATSENACTAFLEGGSESRIGLLCHNDPINKTDPMGLDTAVIVGLQREDSNNVFGHVSVAMTGQGVFSFGTAKSDWASSASSFVAGQSEHRTQFIYVVPTTPAQEQAIRQSLEAQNQTKLPDAQKNPIAGYQDNCATRTSEALKAGGIDIGKTRTPTQVANKMERLVSQDKANATAVPNKANIENYPKLKEFDPKR